MPLQPGTQLGPYKILSPDIGSQVTAISLLVCLASAALTLPGCGRPDQRLPPGRPAGDIKAAEVRKTDDGSYHVRWTVEPPGSPVAVFASTDPANIPHTEPVAETTEAEAIVSGLDPRQRYYFELVPEGGRGFASATRFVKLQGARNVRDLGGYETQDGRRVRWGNVFRSDELTDLTDADVTLIGSMGIRVVCDLRRESRREAVPDRLPAQNAPAILNLDISAATAGRQSALTDWSDEGAEAQMAEGYALRIRRAGPLYGRMLDALIDPANRPFLFHCQGGKDRAGTGAALLLLALGVPEETVVEDYLLTNQAYEQASFDLATRAAELGVSTTVMDVLRSARPLFINTALHEMRAMSGSVDAYLGQEVGLTGEERDRLRAELLH